MKKFFLIFFTIYILFSSNAYAHNYVKCSPLIIEKIEDYLSSFTNLTANFTQNNDRGKTNSGVFYMKRPYKMKLAYNDPALIILYNRGKLTYFDVELNSVRQHKIHNFILRAILEGKMNHRNLKCLNTTENNNEIILNANAYYDLAHSSHLVFHFTKTPYLSLKTIENLSKNEYMKIDFSDLDYSHLNDKNFILKACGN